MKERNLPDAGVTAIAQKDLSSPCASGRTWQECCNLTHNGKFQKGESEI